MVVSALAYGALVSAAGFNGVPRAAAGPHAAQRTQAARVYRIQLGAFHDPKGPALLWERLAEAYPDLLSDRRPYVQVRDSHSGRAPLYRLQTGTFATAAAAGAICGMLKVEAQPCFVVRSEAAAAARDRTRFRSLQALRATQVAADGATAADAGPTAAPAPRGRGDPLDGLEHKPAQLTATIGRPTALETLEERPAIEFDIDAPPKTRHRLAPGVGFGTKARLEYDLEKNYDLDANAADDLSKLDPEWDVALSLELAPSAYAFVNMVLSRPVLFEDRDETRRPRTSLDLDEAYVVLQDVFDGASLQIGRQDFTDERQWLYDEELDGVRFYYRWDSTGIELSASREELIGKDLLNKDDEPIVNNYFAVGRYAVADDWELNGYVLARDDRSRRRRDRVFLGVRSIGELSSRLDHWLDAAYVTGSNGSDDLRAFAVDVGAIYTFKGLPWRPHLSLAYAFGSGDSNRDDDVDRDFRQTGLDDNSDKLGGVTSFKYYGEVLDPELSNLGILTVGGGFRPVERASLDLVYHRYWQHHAEDDIHGSDLEVEPDGESADIGHGLDLIVGYRAIEDLDIALMLGGFFPGRAFPGDADPAYKIGIEVGYDF